MKVSSTIRAFSFISLAFLYGTVYSDNSKNTAEEASLRAIACDMVRLCQNRLPLPGAVSAPQADDGLDTAVAQLIGSNDENVLRSLSEQNVDQIVNGLASAKLLMAKKSLGNVAIENLAVYEFDKFLDLKNCPTRSYSEFVGIIVPILSGANGEPMTCYRSICRALMGNSSSWGSFWSGITSVANCDHLVIGSRLKQAVGSLPRQVKNKLLAVIAPKGFEGPDGDLATKRVLEALKYRLAIDKNRATKK